MRAGISGRGSLKIPALLFKVGWNSSIKEVIKLPNRQSNQLESEIDNIGSFIIINAKGSST